MVSTPRTHSSSWNCLSPEVFYEKGVAVIMKVSGYARG